MIKSLQKGGKKHLVTRLGMSFRAPRQSKQRGKCREPIRKGRGYPRKSPLQSGLRDCNPSSGLDRHLSRGRGARAIPPAARRGESQTPLFVTRHGPLNSTKQSATQHTVSSPWLPSEVRPRFRSVSACEPPTT